MDKLIKSNQTIYEYLDGGVIHGYVKRRADDPPNGDPWIEWKGAKIPHQLYQQVMAFFVWTYNITKPGADEAMVQLFYNDETKSWLAWPPPQRGWGMSVKTLDDHPNWKQSEAFLGYQLLGTGHHHCSGSAFQSGTDLNDERLANGLHYTVGNLDKDYVSLHARVVFNGNMKETKLSEWVEISDRYVEAVHDFPELSSLMYAYTLESKPGPEVSFPESWKENFIRGTGPVTTIGYHSQYPKSTALSYGTQATKTPATLGEEALENMERDGITFFEMAAACKVMNSHPREQWNMNCEAIRRLDDMLRALGLNPRWLEKWVEVEEQIRPHMNAASGWE